jgi:putative transposase
MEDQIYGTQAVFGWSDQHIIESIEEAQNYAMKWFSTYNNDRPNMGVVGITPAAKLKQQIAA